jgi:hypothetical protein
VRDSSFDAPNAYTLLSHRNAVSSVAEMSSTQASGVSNAHRRAVNALAQHFRAQGWVDTMVAANVAAEVLAPPDRMNLAAVKLIDLGSG